MPVISSGAFNGGTVTGSTIVHGYTSGADASLVAQSAAGQLNDIFVVETDAGIFYLEVGPTGGISIGVGGEIAIGPTANRLGFFNRTPAAKPTVTGSKGANAALASLMTGLAALGLVTDSTT